MPRNHGVVPEALLFGRERELHAVEELLDRVGERGGALVIRGEAGVGKSSILEAAKSLADARGMSVLAAIGVQSETNLPFTGLYEMLRPILGRAERLPGPQQKALRGAFGLTDAPAADLFLIALGALDLLAEFATQRPLLLVIDDAQWLDQSSASILAFIARRIQSEPIVLLIGSRDAEAPFNDTIAELRIEGLDDVAATALLQARNPELPVAARERILRESAGNPLALVELPKSIAEHSSTALLPGYLPLTARLERAFASRISGLPLSTFQVLLIAAIDEGSRLDEVLRAARFLGDAEVSLDALTPALASGLISADGATLHFRHPLVRSAIHNSASLAERIEAHKALARALDGDPDRSVWHRAAATLGHDDAVAEELEAAAARSLKRGDVRGAIQALDRAAQLSNETAQRARWLLQAAELAFDIGWPNVVVDLLARADTLELSSRDRFKLVWYREAAARSVSGGEALREIADNIKHTDDVDLALDLLSGPATNGWWSEPDQEVCDHVIEAVESAGISSEDDPRFLLIVAMTSPIDRGAFIIERLRRLWPSAGGDAHVARLLGIAAIQVGDFFLAERFLTSASTSLRNQGRLTLLAHVLALRAWCAIYLSNRNVAVADAGEGVRLAGETSQPAYVTLARAAEAMLAALQGKHDLAEELAAEAERTSQTFGTLMAEIQMARGMNALGAGRYDDAYRHFRRMFDASDSAYHPMRQCFFIGDLAEAAIQSGHREDAEALLVEMEQLGQRTPSPQFQLSLQYARAILADDSEAEHLFEAALNSELVRSPFRKARIRLAFAVWLRHQRRSKDARPLLQAAMEAFDVLGALPWSERARQELRAAGVTIDRRTPELREALTPQELQIALMAAEGLSNREIGQKLYLSHRTVGSHLYKIFPKLNITSRYQLRDVLVAEAQ